MLQKTNNIYEFGRFTLNVADCVFRCGRQEIRLEPKAFDLLVFFVLHAGERVNREQIKAAVWGEVCVGDNNVDRKIADLRGVFRKYDRARKYIENVRGRGWRFEVEVTERPGSAPLGGDVAAGGLAGGSAQCQPDQAAIPERPTGASAADQGVRPTFPATRLVGIAVLAVAAIAAAVTIVTRELSPANSGPHDITYRQLTWDGRPKEGPLVSDGRYVYFSERTGEAQDGPVALAAVPISGGDVILPPNPVDPRAQVLSIARNTQDIAYGRWGAEADLMLYVWRQRQRLLDPAVHIWANAARISPDGRSIAYVTESEQDGALIIRDLGDHPNVRRIPVSGLPGTPTWSPDGSRIRYPVSDPISEAAVFWEAGRDGSNPHRLPMVSKPRFGLRNGSWIADGRYFIYSETSAGAWSSSLWIRRENGGAGQGQPVPLTNNPMSFDFPATASLGNTVFAKGSTWKNQLDRYDARRGEFTAFWQDVAAVDVSFSNDGAWAAYRRATDDTLWIAKGDGSERRQLTWPPLRAYQPHWSPDGQRIAFMAEAPNQPNRIFIVGASGGEPREAKPGDALEQGVPSWSADGRYLVFGELRHRHSDDDMVIRLLDLKTGKETILPGSEGKWTPRWSPDGRYIAAVAANSESLALFDCARRRWTPLVTAHSIGDPVWSLDSRFVHFSALTDAGRALFRVRVADAVVERLAPYPPSQIGWSGVAPDGSPLVLNSTRIEEIYAIDFK